MPNIRIYIASSVPPNEDAEFQIAAPLNVYATSSQPTDAELLDIGNRILASDYIQNGAWGSTAELVYISRPSPDQAVYSIP